MERQFDSGWVGAGADDDLDRRLAAEAATDPFDLTRPHVMTALGPIAPDELGPTLAWERVAARPPEDPNPDLVLDDPNALLAELEDLYNAGGRGIVDATGPAAGRDAATAVWAAARAPVHVVLATGDGAPRQDDEDLAAAMIRELTVGIDGTAARAGAIVVDVPSGPPAPHEAATMRAAAAAALATGAPLLLWAPSGAPGALDLFEAAGVAPARVTVGGLDPKAGGDLAAILDRGAFVTLARGAAATAASDEALATLIARLLAVGLGGRLLLASGLHRRAHLRAYGGGPGWVGLMERLPLALMAAGLDAAAVRRLMSETPAQALTIGGRTE